MEYQYRHGGKGMDVARKLLREGGVQRFYRGLAPALLLAPVSRFGDTAANEMALSSLEGTAVPLAVQTACASATAALWRLAILPLDAWKVMKQVQGKEGLDHLIQKVRQHPSALWHGATGVLAANAFGHYPFFFTQNTLRHRLPELEFRHGKHLRNAAIGLASAVVSDSICNPIRVLKVNRQTSLTPLRYMDAARRVVEVEGFLGLWGRGLKTRILVNGLQGAVFTVLWREFVVLFDVSK